MAMKMRTTCAVEGCVLPISGANNLCDDHRLPGMAYGQGESTMVVISWLAEHEGQAGIVVINDFSCGRLFRGGDGFEKKLRQQGFTDIRLLTTLEELDAIRSGATELADWSGPWQTAYPWEEVQYECGNSLSN